MLRVYVDGPAIRIEPICGYSDADFGRDDCYALRYSCRPLTQFHAGVWRSVLYVVHVGRVLGLHIKARALRTKEPAVGNWDWIGNRVGNVLHSGREKSGRHWAIDVSILVSDI